jgi:cell shape-determining protein MreD
MTLATLAIVFVLYFGTGVALFRLIKVFGFRANDPDSEISFATAVAFIWPLILAALVYLTARWAVHTLFKRTMGIS